MLQNQPILKWRKEMSYKPKFKPEMEEFKYSYNEDENIFHVSCKNGSNNLRVTKSVDYSSEEQLLDIASFLLGRQAEVQEVDNGYVVLYMSFTGKQPPKESTPIKALQSFVNMKLKDIVAEGKVDEFGFYKGEFHGN